MTVRHIAGAPPAPDTDADRDAAQEKKNRYINRELSWLAFNGRVLEEACRPSVPLLERVKFLAISAKNLDEFFMIRAAGLAEQARQGIDDASIDGLSPREQLSAIRGENAAIMLRQEQCWRLLRAELAKEGLYVCTGPDDVTEQERSYLESYFDRNLFTALSPIIVDAAHPLPFLPNLGLAAVVRLGAGKNKLKNPRIHRYGKAAKAVIVLPGKLPRFVPLPDDGTEIRRCIAAEDIIEMFLAKFFPDRKIKTFGLIHVTRDSDLDLEEDAEDLVNLFETAVRERRRGRVIRLIVNTSLREGAVKFLMQELDLQEDDLYATGEPVCLSHISELADLFPPEKKAALQFKPFQERFPERITDFRGDCFAAIRSKDMIIHHPYETFDTVVDYLNQAAKDNDVIAIKQTLYRTSNDSPIVKALIRAAESGKAVTVAVELKARFDEEANIRWARDLERAGAQVVYGFIDLKTHAKLSLVVRREGDILRNYAHCGTGNYHPVTARSYTDLSFFTCDEGLCRDIANIFNFLTGYADTGDFRHIVLAPLYMRDKLRTLILKEISNAQAGKPAAIWAKMNSLVDKEMIDLFYAASQAGVEITLIVRGICCLRAGVPGLSEHITVKSIVGRFLEHARIYCFADGAPMPSPDAKLYISSADLMPRNLDRRVETLIPVHNRTVHEQILGQIMPANVADNTQSWYLQPDNSYRRRSPAEGEKPFSAHSYFIENPSLSGRGKAQPAGRSGQEEVLPDGRYHSPG